MNNHDIQDRLVSANGNERLSAIFICLTHPYYLKQQSCHAENARRRMYHSTRMSKCVKIVRT